MKEDKGFATLLKSLPSTDHLIFVEFGPVQGMPWVAPCPKHRLLQEVKTEDNASRLWTASNLTDALMLATRLVSEDDSVVVTGSLYLVSDLLRLVREYK